METDTKLIILYSLFISALVAANLLGNKITTFVGISFSVGIFAYPLTFLVTDIVEEVYGKKKTRDLIIGGFVALVFVLFITMIAVALPPADRFTENESYVKIFSVSTRILIASIVAFLISQFHDMWAFEKIKEKTKGKYLWLRNNVSTIISQFIDTTIFIFIAFYGISPKFDFAFMWQLIIPYWILKVVLALMDTPFVYLGVRWLRGKKVISQHSIVK